MDDTTCQFYEREELRSVTGDTIRPGGLDLTHRALSFCKLDASARILDVACGTGATVQQLRDGYGYRAVGIDASELLLSTGLMRRPDLALARALGESLPFARGQLQAVFLECSLSVIGASQKVLGELDRVLAPDGFLILSDLYLRNPQAAGSLRALPVACCLQGALSRSELFDCLQSHGFEIAFWEDHSASLKELTGRIIMQSGSMQAFWGQTVPGSVDPFDLQLAISRAKPGYYLLVAKKKSLQARY
jgi:arsenite methyltransferase